MTDETVVTKASLSVRALAGKRDTENLDGRKLLGSIYGSIRGATLQKNTLSGEMTPVLVGAFEATSAITGEITRSGRLFLPSAFQEAIYSHASKLEEPNEIALDIDVYAAPAKNPVGYTYEVEQRVQAGVLDPLKVKRLEVASRLKGLPAPAAPAPAEPEQPQVEHVGKGRRAKADADAA